MRKVMVLSLLASLMSYAEVIEHPKNLKEEAKVYEKAQKRWVWSAAALVAASFVDVHSSWRKSESNAFLRSPNGTFGAKGLGVKMGIVGGILAGQTVLVHYKPSLAAPVSIANFGLAGVKVAVAAHNYQIAPPKYLLNAQ